MPVQTALSVQHSAFSILSVLHLCLYKQRLAFSVQRKKLFCSKRPYIISRFGRCIGNAIYSKAGGIVTCNAGFAFC